MAETPATRPSLLLRLRNAHDADAWQQFVALYAPLVYRFGRRQHLQDADAADLTQDVLRAVSGSIGRLEYDARRGSFRGWLFTLVRRKLCDLLTRRQRQCPGTGESATLALLQEQPARDGQEWWDQEYERQVFAWVAEQVRGDFTPTTWQAFWQTAVEAQSAADVAERLGMSVGAVYIAKSRVQARIREQVRQVVGDAPP
jgi:RNA polymerase sigma-70 factor (ECF subfamily)